MKQTPSQKRRRTRILVIDDDPSIRLGLSEILASEGYQVNTAASAGEICRITETLDPDIILLDLVIPGVNGFEAVEALKANACTAGIPVVAMTASWLGSQKERLATVGFHSSLRKPFTGSTLCQEIRGVEAAISAMGSPAVHDSTAPRRTA